MNNSSMRHGYLSVTIMVVVSMILTYYFTMTLLLQRNITDNRNKFYQALLMAFWMGFVELGMVIYMTSDTNIYYVILLIIFGLLILLLTYMIQQQKGINENQFLLSMIEHHEMALEMSRQLLKKGIVRDPKVIVLLNEILESQQREINDMYDLLRARGVPLDIRSLSY